MPEYDRPVAGLSDLVVERLTKLDPDRIAVIGNAAILRQPRNIRNLKAVAEDRQGRLRPARPTAAGRDRTALHHAFHPAEDEAHLKANRLPMPIASLAGLEAAVVEEFERAVREHVLNRPAN